MKFNRVLYLLLLNGIGNIRIGNVHAIRVGNVVSADKGGTFDLFEIELELIVTLLSR